MTDTVEERFPHKTVAEMQLAGALLQLETGRLAKQAGGSVLVRYGDTVVLVAASSSAEPRGVDFLPLTVDYEERLYAVGRIPGSWTRREGRPHEKAILSARLTDRPIRPLFPEGYRNDVQVISLVMSVDGDHSPEICSMIGASAALAISDIPFEGPVGACEVGLVDGQFVLNPNREQSARSRLHLTVAGTEDAILMVEAGADEVDEETMLEAILFAHEAIREIVALQKRLCEQAGKPKRFPGTVSHELLLAVKEACAQALAAVRSGETELEAVRHIALAVDPQRETECQIAFDKVVEEFLWNEIQREGTGKIQEALARCIELSRDKDALSAKKARESLLDSVQAELAAEAARAFPGYENMTSSLVYKLLKVNMRRMLLDQGVRVDGRRPGDIRPVTCEVGVLPRTHGSAVFTRGETQVLSVCTLGAVGDVQILDDVDEEESKRFMHHYNFPPFSVGETRPMRGPGRREIGHGALAERAVLPMLPPDTEFPYTIRVVSEVLESNGSTSMASVCATTLALMDAGVPLSKPVAGVAMGLIKEEDKSVVLTDIQGIEDFLGDMDFKVAGTRDGVTALQMDMKVKGVDRQVLKKALEEARKARLLILEKMLAVLPRPRSDLSPYAPRIIVMTIDPEKIRDVIGPGGKMINKIIAETGTKIDIEQDGRVYIAAVDAEGGKKAQKMIEALTREVEPGAVYLGRVVRLTSFGAFVEILPGKEGLVHISELADHRVGKVEDVVSVGDEILVKVIEIDRLGRINLSRKQALPREEREQVDTGPGRKRRNS